MSQIIFPVSLSLKKFPSIGFLNKFPQYRVSQKNSLVQGVLNNFSNTVCLSRDKGWISFDIYCEKKLGDPLLQITRKLVSYPPILNDVIIFITKTQHSYDPPKNINKEIADNFLSK